MSVSNIEPLLNTKHAAEILGVSERTVWALANAGRLASIRIGRSVRFHPADIERFIAASRHGRAEKGIRK